MHRDLLKHYMEIKKVFSPIKESEVAKEMTKRYLNEMIEFADCDAVVVGGGPAGLCAAYELGKHNVKTALIEASVAPGGGSWVSGQLMSAMIVRKPANTFLDEIGIDYEDMGNFVVMKHAGQLPSTLLSEIFKMPSVKVFNAVAVEDLIVREGVVSGVVTNWALVTKAHGTQSCMDPNVIESKVVISSCGHDGPFGATGVKRLAEIGMIEPIPGMKALDMNASEDAILHHTGEIVPGMIVCGMEVAEAYGCNRMGPTFGAMLLSGQKAAQLAMRKLGVKPVEERLQEMVA